jgi:hypothetical protein
VFRDGSGLSADALRKVLWTTPCRLYGIDEAADRLRIAAR